MADDNTKNEEFEQLCAAYVLHLLDSEERKTFEQMLANATEEQRELHRKMQSVARKSGFTGEGDESNSELTERLINETHGEAGPDNERNGTNEIEEKHPESGFSWAGFTAAAAFALLFISLSLLFYSLNLNYEISRRQEVIQNRNAEISALQNKLQQKRELLSILEGRRIQLAYLSGMEANPDGSGKVIWSSEKSYALLQVSNLPPLPGNTVYQLWQISNSKTVSAGIFTVENRPDNFFKIGEIKNTTNTLTVTAEPKGGSPRPTGDMYLMGNVGEQNE